MSTPKRSSEAHTGAPQSNGSRPTDRIFADSGRKMSDFKFDRRTAHVFDDMVNRSVPFYDEIQRMTTELAADFAVPGTNLYDLGCATGTTLLALVIFFAGTVNAVRNVPQIYIDNARTLGATRLRLYRTVILPAIFPELRATILLSLGTAWAAGRDLCKSFCRCSGKTQQNQCLAACRACNNNPTRLCGGCGSYVCCGAGKTCCGDACVDLENDFDNCGACGDPCDPPGPYAEGACVYGTCMYRCVDGAMDCDGICTILDSDPNNCGACGNVCPASAPVCNGGICSGCLNSLQTNCGGYCTYLCCDPSNCGACGNVCLSNSCVDGECDFGTPPDDGGGRYAVPPRHASGGRPGRSGRRATRTSRAPRRREACSTSTGTAPARACRRTGS